MNIYFLFLPFLQFYHPNRASNLDHQMPILQIPHALPIVIEWCFDIVDFNVVWSFILLLIVHRIKLRQTLLPEFRFFMRKIKGIILNFSCFRPGGGELLHQANYFFWSKSQLSPSVFVPFAPFMILSSFLLHWNCTRVLNYFSDS